MVRLLAAVLGAALLSTSTLAAPARGMHRRTMPEDKPATQEPPKMGDKPPMEQPKYELPKYEQPKYEQPKYEQPKGDSPPKSMDEQPKSSGMMDKPPRPTNDMKGEPPMSTTSMMNEPPKSTPMSESSSAKSEPPMSEPPMSEPPKYESPKYESPKSEPPKSEPPKYESPKSEPPKSEPPKSEPPKSEPPKAEPTSGQPPQSTPAYGSGSNPWSPTYNDCVQKCIAQYGVPKETTWTPPPKESQAPGAKPTHTVMVAPRDGVPRFLPFAVNATVGDTVRFVWTGQKEHSVTMSSSLAVCNKTQSPDAFDSELLSGKDGQKTYDVVVKDDKPVWFYCKFGDHCNKGMFGGINVKSAFGSEKSVGAMMNKWAEKNPDLQAAWGYVQNKTAGTPAEKWGNSIDVGDVPEDKYVDVAQNILWTRVNLAANPGMQDMGSAQTPDNSPLKFVDDVSTLLAESNAPPVQQSASPSKAEAASQPTESKTGSGLPSHSSAAVVSVLVLLASALLM